MRDEKSSFKKSYQALEEKFKALERSHLLEKNEKLAAVSKAEVAERGLSQKETNDNVLLGYSIIRRVVAQKFSGYNMIELDHLATKEAQKGEQPILAEFDEPIRVEPGVQEAGEDTEKVVEFSISETKQDDLSWLTKGALVRGGQIIYSDFEVEGEEVGVVASGSTLTGVEEAREERRALKGERRGDRSALNLSGGRPVFPYAYHHSAYHRAGLKIRLVNASLSKLEQVSTGDLPVAAGSSSDPAVDPSMVETIKNISAGKRSAFGLASRGSAPKMQRMAGSSSTSVTPSKSTSSTRVGVGQTPISRVTKRQANHELAERYQAEKVQAPPSRQAPKGTGCGDCQQLKSMRDEKSSFKKSYQALEEKFKALERSHLLEKNEKLALCLKSRIHKGLMLASSTIHYDDSRGPFLDVEVHLSNEEVKLVIKFWSQRKRVFWRASSLHKLKVDLLETPSWGIFVELEVLKKETNDNFLLNYSIIRRVVARKFSGYNMIELDHLATKEAQKGEQPILAEFNKPIRVEPGSPEVT
ncbi:hypothetical protein FNV43_RR02677 [Rhamnella rubrinervis]|uniref:Uncharacterized protein n=1 Tax=Rhamnella rubrinervis TaxID=2594499 RepID=A0A8K0MTW0_9ROSA|nr:hypothetical protein FNV43_RR02677 [Rhamnella rubrinervis]